MLVQRKQLRSREMMKKKYLGGFGPVFLITILFFPIAVSGQVVTIGWQVSGSGSQSGTVQTDLDWDVINANPEEIYTWELQGSIEIDLGGGNYAYIDGLSLGIKGDPRISFGFSAAAGFTDTHFTFTSNVMPVSPALINAQAVASASVTLGFPGDYLIGNYGGGKAYRSVYNGSNVFAELVNTPAYYLDDQHNGASESVSSTPIAGAITGMQAMWDVTVSAGGSASGSSSYRITGDTIPEPATIVLLGLGGFGLLRKRS
jgi:hypothetical protein